jgi:histidinol-phosphatase (PHP family)
MHSIGSDGHDQPEEVVQEAIKAGISYMCFTDHYFYPKGDYFKGHRESFFSADYIKEVKRLQEFYKEQIDISFGTEMDWLPTHIDWTKNEIKKHNFDYVMGSLHSLQIKGNYCFLFYGENWKQGWLDDAKKAESPQKFVEQYYTQLRKMIKSGLFDSVGHLDLIKYYNKGNFFFSESSDWYKKTVLKTLDAINKSNIVLELNSHGIIKPTGEQYPSPWILEEARKRNIPITIGTDSHRLEQIGLDLDKAYELARQAGYSEIVRFKARKRIIIPI